MIYDASFAQAMNSDILIHLINIAVIAVMLYLFITETYPPVVVAMIGVACFLLLGVLSPKEILHVASNPAPPTIAGMFIMSAALVRTGMLARLTFRFSHIAQSYPKLVIPLLLGLTIFLSAFVNNTPVVIMMIPVIISIAQQINQRASRYLIPLSHASILGGTCTLIGSSTNILVSGILESQGYEGIGMFEMAILGLTLIGIGACYFFFVGRHLLPDRPALADFPPPHRFLTDVLIQKESNFIGQSLNDISFFKDHNITVVDVVRDERSLGSKMMETGIEANDHLILESSVAGVMSVQELKSGGLSTVTEKEAEIVEALVAPNSPLLKRRLRDARIQRRYGIYVLAIHRSGTNLRRSFADIRLNAADTLLIEGAREDILRLSEDMRLINLSEPSERPYRRGKAPLAALALLAVVGLGALNIIPLVALLAVATTFVLVTRCIEAEEAFEAIDLPIIALMFSMLLVGFALEKSGTLAWIVQGLLPILADRSPFIVIASVFFITSILTEMISNTAVATVMTPFAISLGLQLDLDPRTLALAVLIAASASFSTPIGYQTNTLVYNPGGYRFTDFLKVGIPMNILVGLATTLLLPLWWPL